MIDTRKFIIFFISYILVSTVLAFGVSFTSVAWIIYSFSIAPLYLICILYCLNLYVNHRHQKIKFKGSSWYLILVSQLLFMIVSPVDCHLWSQGKPCYSFLQTRLDINYLYSPQWRFVEMIFPISLLLYFVLMFSFLKQLKLNTDR
jgi:hypothetical protein